MRYKGLEIYTPDLTNRHEITHAISVSMTVYYNDLGKITIVLPMDKENADLAKNGSLVLDKAAWTTYIIQNTVMEPASGRITLNGYTADYLLSLRTVPDRNQITEIEKDTYELIRKNLRGLPGINLAPLKGLTEVTDSDVGYGSLLTKVTHLLDRGNLGRRMVWDDKTRTHTFEIYKGVDLTEGLRSMAFRYEDGSARDLVISDDISMDRTTIYISGELLDGRRIVEVLGDGIQGKDRREKWIKDVPRQESGDNEAQFRVQLRTKLAEEALKYIRRTSFDVSIDPEELGTRYQLGDIVNCLSTDFGIRMQKRVTGLSYTIDDTGERTALTLGEPDITILEEMMSNDGD